MSTRSPSFPQSSLQRNGRNFSRRTGRVAAGITDRQLDAYLTTRDALRRIRSAVVMGVNRPDAAAPG